MIEESNNNNSQKSLIITGHIPLAENSPYDRLSKKPVVITPPESILVPNGIMVPDHVAQRSTIIAQKAVQAVVAGKRAKVFAPDQRVKMFMPPPEIVDDVPITLVGVEEPKPKPRASVSERAQKLKNTTGTRTWNRKARRKEARKSKSQFLDK